MSLEELKDMESRLISEVYGGKSSCPWYIHALALVGFVVGGGLLMIALNDGASSGHVAAMVAGFVAMAVGLYVEKQHSNARDHQGLLLSRVQQEVARRSPPQNISW
ncbi:hypothetical protein CBF45_12665 [Bordetella sp. J329]|nr:hypothetical protein CBF45_12665 [Bordetella sp. J329]